MKTEHIILVSLIIAGGAVAYYVYGPNGVINAPYVPHTSQASHKEPSPEQAMKAKEAVKLILKDPESAQFRNLRLDIVDQVCGEVNARNGYGGYTGFKLFHVVNDKAFIEKEAIGSKQEVALIENTNAMMAASCETAKLAH